MYLTRIESDLESHNKLPLGLSRIIPAWSLLCRIHYVTIMLYVEEICATSLPFVNLGSCCFVHCLP